MRHDLLRIMIVDDNAHMRTLLVEILRAIGVRHVVEAPDGSAAMNAMRTQQVDIVISDLAMRPMDGIEFVRRLRTSPDSPSPLVPVIMITGHSTTARVAEARDVGVNEILSKPVTAKGVLDRLGRVIEHPRTFVRSAAYFGPNRRRRKDPSYSGPWRRSEDV